MKISGIYKIQSIIKPERVYIGSAVNLSERWRHHLNDLKLEKHGNNRLQNHYNKYGISDLCFSILLGCDKKDLLKTEQYFIDSYNPYFNICKLAGSRLGMKHSPKSCLQMSKKRKGTNIGVENHFFGKHHTIESNLQNSKTHEGKTAWNKGKRGVPKETSENMSKSAKKRPPMSEEARKNHSKAMIGKNTWTRP